MHAMRTAIGLVILGLVFGCSCGGDDDDSTIDARPIPDAAPPDALPSGAPEITTVTYNIGMIATVVGPEKRLPLVREGLKALDTDVICLEECYAGPYTSPEQMAADLAEEFPYSHWTATGHFASYNGLLLVSKYPLYSKSEWYYTAGNEGPQTVDRMAIGAIVVNEDEGWSANVTCTHFHAGLDPEDVTKKTTEMNELVAFAEGLNPAGGPIIMLGDYNAGPGAPPEDCECEETPDTCDPACKPADMTSYQVAIDAGFTDPFPTDPSPFWTSSREQYTAMEYISGLYPGEPSERIDHCFYKDLGDSDFVTGGLVLDDPVDIETENSTGPITIHWLSDHMPVMCTFGTE